MTDDLLNRFRERFGDTANVRVVLAPGRVNLIGDHTDYNDGFVLPMTIDRAVYWAIRPRSDDTVRLYSVNFDEEREYQLAQSPVSGSVSANNVNWVSYVAGVIEELRSRRLLDTGFEGVVYGNVPLGGGLSSSAALEVSIAVALQNLFGFDLSAVDTALLCQHVENQYAGVRCGIMDQFASRLGRKDHALFLDCRSHAYRDIPLNLRDTCVMIVDSGVKRELAGSKYNDRRAECEQGLDLFKHIDNNITALRDMTPALLQQHDHKLPDNVRKRCRHVVTENQRVLEAVALLEQGHLVELGTLMNESHNSLRDLYEVSCPELNSLVDIARGTEGVLGARMTGAGFGGCVVYLIKTNAVDILRQRVMQIYSRQFGLEPKVFVIGENLEAG